MQLGILLDTQWASGAHESATALAQRAEAGRLDLVVVGPGDAEAIRTDTALDPWTTAVWVAARTGHIAIGVSGDGAAPDPSDHAARTAPYPEVVAKARQTLESLAGVRLVADAGWVVAPEGAERAQILALADHHDLPVVVPVRTAHDVERLIPFAASHGGNPSGRSVAARSRRRPGIDYDGLPESLHRTAIEPGDDNFSAVRSTYLRSGAPGLVLRPQTPDEVADAVVFAHRHRHLPLGVRSGGHGISGRSTNDGGLVIDVGALDGIEVVDPRRRRVRVGPGATWKEVAAALNSHGWALGSGDYGGVGVGGLATAGGIGLLSRHHGLTIDHLRSADLVLADGRQVRVSDQEHPDLFWAVRGAGANVGIATSFEFEVDEVDDVGWAKLVLVTDDIEQALLTYGRLASSAPRDTTVFLVTGRPRDGQSVVQLYALVDSGDADVIVERLTPFVALGDLLRQEVVLTRYAGVMAEAEDVGPDGHHGYGEPVSRSALLPELTPAFARDAARLLHSGTVAYFQLRAMGGAIADVPPDRTAFAHRRSAFQVTAMGRDHGALDPAFDALAVHFHGLYLSFDTDLRPQRLDDAFPPPVLARLRETKALYDPDNLFRDNFNIAPTVDLTVSHAG
ncbi:FAD-binding oxidoreductase [Mumia sp.]|uniref:FAD-binding oxidoreductase n=1 Tax=Mumia sp. TaxID=1965300 RepID=UPI00260BA973|nr:FAD-binding oxidoreductase [Mumia sp.]MDD9349587.1 FAD-binding oxidoreductase [Mumia sp.]